MDDGRDGSWERKDIVLFLNFRGGGGGDGGGWPLFCG
jgi:hypothetical protein